MHIRKLTENNIQHTHGCGEHNATCDNSTLGQCGTSYAMQLSKAYHAQKFSIAAQAVFHAPKAAGGTFQRAFHPSCCQTATSSTSVPTCAQIPLRVCVGGSQPPEVRDGPEGEARQILPTKETNIAARHKGCGFLYLYEIHSQERERRNTSPRGPALDSFVAVSFSRYAELRLMKIARCVKRNRLEN